MINFKKVGKGKQTLVFLHGWGGAWQSWAPILEKFTIYNLQFTIYAVDLPGFGLSSLTRAYGLADYVTDLVEFFKKEGIVKAVLIGHSFGGQVAAKFALNYPGFLSGLVLVDSAVIRRDDFRIRFDIALARAGKRLLQTTRLDRLYPMIRPWYYRFRGMEGSDYFRATGNPNLRATASKIFRENLSLEIHRIKIPTLIFWGEKDPPELTPVKFAHVLQREIKGSKLVVVPGAGHFSYLEDQERFIKELNDYVDRLK